VVQLSEIFGVPITAFFSEDQLDSHHDQLAGAALTAEEAKALQLLRRLTIKRVRTTIIQLMEDLVSTIEAKK